MAKLKSTFNLGLGTSYTLGKVVAGVQKSAQEGEDQLIEILSMPPTRSGKHYAGNPKPSSAPGEAPSPQSGLYRQGVAHTPPSVKGTTVSSQVASRGKQAAKLELGDEKVAPRPHVSRLVSEPNRRKRLLAAFIIGARRFTTGEGRK